MHRPVDLDWWLAFESCWIEAAERKGLRKMNSLLSTGDWRGHPPEALLQTDAGLCELERIAGNESADPLDREACAALLRWPHIQHRLVELRDKNRRERRYGP